MSAATFHDELLKLVSEAVGPGTAILTLSTKNLNRITVVAAKVCGSRRSAQ